ncbi:TetR/AcrR family transcriptional regulator [Streptomyces iconiensis]|uniref:TetR/AcrR family transcriptional regulator C-terminal domain-containing protein n=1 Tax=Streptomyces iconiensis TaxID=1384038 RepID=A0ABT6ZNH3_9ACTN|nr:TetR/AcrR family transcriptional regulator C-terminal domain-containing protein [Streptomyces iconiensis]MDJ1130608.1 TetR/AcrR family transcriptional regulator C-terminal domain-containing protein [Streptomyces iconiensis]
MAAPKKFSREQVAAAALRLTDTRGLEALSMRTLAAELGTGPMTLYNYVDGREGLELLVVEAVLEGADWPETGSGDWRDDVRKLAEVFWRTIRSHPHVIPLIAERRTVDEPILDFGERMLEALARSGRSGRELLVAFRLVSGFIVGFTQGAAGRALISPGGESASAVIARARTLDPERFPRVVEIATASVEGDRTGEFRAGLDLLIAGLAADARPGGGREG